MANSDDNAAPNKRKSRRANDRITRNTIIALAAAFIVQVGGGIFYAGRMLERVIKIEEHVKITSPQELQIITNALNINHHGENQKKIFDSLIRIENRLN